MKKAENAKVTISKDGPYLVTGNLPLDKEEIGCDAEGNPVEFKKVKDYPTQEKYALCRCGASKNKPYCDGSHAKMVPLRLAPPRWVVP